MAGSNHARLVLEAQNGDRWACEELIAGHLPLLYNIVRRALGAHADVDDVVQETLLRVVRDLPALRDPNSFRSWMVAIAIRQIASHRHRLRATVGQVTIVEEGDEPQDPGFEDLAILRLQVSGQRREVAEASRWLDAENRLLLSLWWQESAGWLTRGELAEALDLSLAHAAVRLQRMREQMELCREVVAALDAQPRCGRLDAVVDRWDGGPSPLWRKRIARHLRRCEACLAASEGQVPLERLLLTFLPLAVPAGLAAFAAALTDQGLPPAAAAATSGAAPGKLAHSVFAHPLAVLATGAVVVGSAVILVTWPETPAEKPAVIAAPPTPHVAPNPAVVPSPTTAVPTPRGTGLTSGTTRSPASPTAAPVLAILLGAWSLESVVLPGRYLTYAGDFAALEPVSATSTEQTRRQATLTVVLGLADPSCVTFRATDGRYLRHMMMRLRLDNDEGTQLFREDATFCPRPGSVPGSVSLESYNYRPQVLRYRAGAIYVNLPDGTRNFGGESSFIARNPWGA